MKRYLIKDPYGQEFLCDSPEECGSLIERLFNYWCEDAPNVEIIKSERDPEGNVKSIRFEISGEVYEFASSELKIEPDDK